MSKANDVMDVEFLELGDPTPSPNPNPDNDVNKDEDIDTNKDKDESQQVNNNDSPDVNEDESGNETDTNNDDADNQDDDQNIQTDETDNSGSDNDDVDSDNSDDTSDSEGSLFESILDSSGLEFEDEERSEILELEETEEGLNQVADRIAQKKAEQHFSSLMEQYPHTSRMLEYEMHGGDPEKYYDAHFPETDYSQLEIQEDDVDLQKQVVAQSLQQQGLEEEDIQSELDDLENAGLLKNRAERSLKVLRKRQEEKKEELEAEREQLRKQRQREAQKQYENTVDVIRNGDIEGIKVPNDKKDEFVNYLFEPVDEQGHTQAQLDSQELGLEQRLLMAYLNFSGYNLDGFINNQVKNSGKRDLRKEIKKSNSKESLRKKGDSTEKPGKPEDIVSPFVS